MEESWEQWLSELEMNDQLLNNSFEEEFNGEDSQKPALTWESHSLKSNAVPSDFKKICQNDDLGTHNSSSSLMCTNSKDQSKEEGNYEETREQRKCKRARSPSKTQDHIMAERKRRENLTRMFIALSATLPGLKKMDKSSVLKDAIIHVKQLQKRVKELEEQNKKRNIESVVYINKSSVAVSNGSSRNSDGFNGHMKAFPNVEVRFSAKDVLIRVVCEEQKGIVPKILAVLETNNLSIGCSSVLPFGNSTLNITITAQMDKEISMTVDDQVKILNEEILKCCNVQ